jgi:hypothetical protein
MYASRVGSASRVLQISLRSTTHPRKSCRGTGGSIDHMALRVVVVGVAMSPAVWLVLTSSEYGLAGLRHSPRDATAATSRAPSASYRGPSAEDFALDFSLSFYISTFSLIASPILLSISRDKIVVVPTKPSQVRPADHRLAQPTPRHALQTPSRLRERLFATEPSIAPSSHASSPNHSQWLRNSYVCPLLIPARCIAYRTAYCATPISLHSSCANDPLLTYFQDGPPPQYQGGPQPPQQAYGGDQQVQGYYQQPPPNQYGSPNPYQQQGQGYGPPQGQYGQPDQQQGMYYQQGPPPQGQGMYPQQQKGGAGGGLFAGLCAGLACCCCLDCLF